MAVNSAFKTSGLAASTGEQNLYSDLVRESIQIHGHDVNYIDRTIQARDDIFGEDSLSQFNKQQTIEDFYNLMKSHEKVKWEREKIEEYVKQIKDLWNKPNQKHFRDYFETTKGYFIMGTGSKIGKRKVTNKLFGADEKTISSAVKKLKIKKQITD